MVKYVESVNQFLESGEAMVTHADHLFWDLVEIYRERNLQFSDGIFLEHSFPKMIVRVKNSTHHMMFEQIDDFTFESTEIEHSLGDDLVEKILNFHEII